jgi:peptide/nickel transport system substrate-binding protein
MSRVRKLRSSPDDPGHRGRGFRRRRPTVAAAGVAALALVLAACGSSSSSSSGNGSTKTTTKGPSQPAGAPVHGGTVAWAELPATTPNFIFPMPPLANFTNANLYEFENLMYRPLYWFGTTGKPTVNFSKSLAKPPVFTNGDKTVTMTLVNQKWSDGEKLEARDVLFWMNLLKAEKAQWGGYVPGFFPDNVASMAMPAGPTGDTVRFVLTSSVNPTWFLYNELSQVIPLPIAWDKTSTSAPAPTASSTSLPDATPAGAKSVYNFLVDQSKDISSYTTNPLWKIVDGPWSLTGFTTEGEATFVPNPKYDGADPAYLAKFVEVPYTTDTSEFDTVESGTGAVQVGYVPSQDMPKLASVQSEGYSAFEWFAYQFNFMALNFESTAVAAIFKQFYIREALQEVINEPGWVKAYYDDVAAPVYGPVPTVPANTFADSYERSDPYPYNPAKAKALLTSHGWTVKPGGQTVCADPSKCGAGIAAGEPLAFKVDYASGLVPITSSMADWKSVAAADLGVQISLRQESFDSVIGNDVPGVKTWDVANWGGGWSYGPDYYASGEELFQTGAGSNHGDYSSPEADALIKATTSVGEANSQSSLDTYQDYIAKQLPVLFQPVAGTEQVVVKGLGGTVLTPNPFYSLDPEQWYFTRK